MGARRFGHTFAAVSILVAIFPFTALANGIIPDNDAKEHATQITSLPYATTADNTLATRELDEPTGCSVRKSLWYTYTPDTDGAATLTLTGAFNYPMLGVYREEAGSLVAEACSETASSLKRLFRGGVTYYFQVGSYYEDRAGQLQFSVTPTSAISGRLTDEGNTPLANQCVSVRTPAGQAKASARSVTDGTYVVFVGPGSYRIQFGCSNGAHQQEWYDNEVDLASADPVEVTEGELEPGINAALVAHPTISGKITDQSGAGVRACVSALRANGSQVSSTLSDTQGAYLIGIPPGEYRIRVADCLTLVRRTQYYSGKYSLAEADPVSTAGNFDVTGIDLQLLPYDIPANDNMSAAKAIEVPFMETMTLHSATQEVGERSTCSPFTTTSLRTVWYSVTPATSVDVLASISYSGFLGVYKKLASESSPAELVEQRCFAGSQHLRFEAGDTYLLQVATRWSHPSTASPLTLSLDPVVPPVNDLIANAKTVSSLPYSDLVDSYHATVESGEATGCGPLGKTIWYRFAPSQSAKVRIDASGSHSPHVAVYKTEGGEMASSATACDRGMSAFDLAVAAGDEYFIQVGSVDGSGGLTRLSVIDVTAPTNDNFADAAPISSLPATVTGLTTNGSRETGEPQACGAAGPSVWYRLDPSADVTAVSEMKGISTVLAVYEGSAMSNLRLVDCNVDFNPPQAFPLDSGKTYMVQISGRYSYDTGNFSLTLAPAEGEQSHTFEAPIPCATLCPYWNQQATAAQRYENSCLPTPPSPEGSWDDLAVTVPETVNGRIPTHLVFSMSPAIDWDSFMCRAEPLNGKYFLTHDANQPEDMCPLLAIGCEESAVVRVTPGQTIVLRAYNWSDIDDVVGGYSFVTKAP